MRMEAVARESDPLREGLVLLCRTLGRPTSVAELGDGMPLVMGRLPPEMVPRALRRIEIAARIDDFALGAFSGYLLPALLLLRDGRTLVLTGLADGMAEVRVPDADGGAQRLPLEELEALYSGRAVLAKCRYRPDGREAGFAASPGEHWFYGALKRYRRAYGEVALAAMVANLLAIATALFAMQVYDRVVPNAAIDTLWLLASGVMLAILFETALRYMRGHLLDTMGKSLDLRLSTLLFERVLATRLSAKPASLGAFSTQIREFEGVREFFTASSAALISDLPFTILFLLVIAMIGGTVALVPALAIVLMVAPGLITQRKLAALSRRNLQEGAIRNSILLESVEHMETIKAARAEGRSLHQWETLTAQLAGTAMRTHALMTALAYGATMVQQLAYVGVVIFGVYRIGAGELTVGALVACSLLSARAIAPMAQVAAILGRWQHTRVALEGLDQLMAAPVERAPGRAFVRLEKAAGAFAIERLVLRHGEGPAVVNVAALSIPAGARVALLGGNGAGKSSLLRLMSGWGDPSDGRLMLDGLSLAQIDPADRRRAIGYLPQDVALLHGTLRDNLNPEGAAVSDADMFAVLDGIGIGPFVRANPLGLDMPILGSTSLSCGQRQAVGLARVLLQDPAVLLLDEPTAFLDQASENRLMAFLSGWLGSRTLVLTTHKKSLLALVDRAVVLRGGQVAMDGPLDAIVSGNQVRSAPEAAAHVG